MAPKKKTLKDTAYLSAAVSPPPKPDPPASPSTNIPTFFAYKFLCYKVKAFKPCVDLSVALKDVLDNILEMFYPE